MEKTHIHYRVPYADTDKMGVVYYANYLIYFERVRNEMLRQSGLSYFEMERMGWGLPVIEAHVDYCSPCFYDDLIEIHGHVASCSALKVRVDCEVRREEVLLAKGYTVHVFMDLRTRRPRRGHPDLLTYFNT